VKNLAVAAAAALSFVAIAAAHGAATVTPHVGFYEAPFGTNKKLLFSYSTYGFPKATGFSIEHRDTPYSYVYDYFPGHAAVADGKFIFSGFDNRGQLLHVTGDWTHPDTVKGNARASHGTHDYVAARLVLGGGGLGKPPQGVEGTPGTYQGPFVSARKVQFVCIKGPEPKVEGFSAGPVHFASTPVHGGNQFSWTSPHNATVHVTGVWKSAHDVEGSVREKNGVTWDYHARLE
jgi:hypothetical protein